MPGEPVAESAPGGGPEHGRRELAGGGQGLEIEAQAGQAQPFGDGPPERSQRTGEQQDIAGPGGGHQVVRHAPHHRPRQHGHAHQLPHAGRAAVQPPAAGGVQLRPRIDGEGMEAEFRARHERLEAGVGDQGDLVSAPGQGLTQTGVGSHVAPGARRHDRYAHDGQYGPASRSPQDTTATIPATATRPAQASSPAASIRHRRTR